MNLLFTSILMTHVLFAQPPQEGTPVDFGVSKSVGWVGLISHIGEQEIWVIVPAVPVGAKWTTDMQNPPVSSADAIRLASKKRLELAADDDLNYWTLSSATLVPWVANEGHWYWEVTFQQRDRPSPDNPRSTSIYDDPSRTLRLVVKMDGTLIEPRIEEKDLLDRSQLLDNPPSKPK